MMDTQDMTGEQPDSRDHKQDLSALLLLAAGTVSFAVFHFVPAFHANVGWEVWLEVGRAFRNLNFLSEPTILIPLFSFVMITFLIVVSPFLVGVLRKSRLCWWMATAMSALATIAFVGLMAARHDVASIGFGGWFLFAAPVLNLLGLLRLRGFRSTDLPG